MRTRLIAGLTAALLALPMAAAADDHPNCYPDAPGCVEVEDELDETVSEPEEEETVVESEVEEAEELTGEIELISVTSAEPEAAATLARTGIESTLLLAAALALVLGGSALLIGSRRRRSHSS